VVLKKLVALAGAMIDSFSVGMWCQSWTSHRSLRPAQVVNAALGGYLSTAQQFSEAAQEMHTRHYTSAAPQALAQGTLQHSKQARRTCRYPLVQQRLRIVQSLHIRLIHLSFAPRKEILPFVLCALVLLAGPVFGSGLITNRAPRGPSACKKAIKAV
jgi:hypothetical protein